MEATRMLESYTAHQPLCLRVQKGRPQYIWVLCLLYLCIVRYYFCNSRFDNGKSIVVGARFGADCTISADISAVRTGKERPKNIRCIQ